MDGHLENKLKIVEIKNDSFKFKSWCYLFNRSFCSRMQSRKIIAEKQQKISFFVLIYWYVMYKIKDTHHYHGHYQHVVCVLMSMLFRIHK